MADARFTVTDRRAPYRAADRGIAAAARALLDDVRALTPVDTGRLRAGWKLQTGRVWSSEFVFNDVPYALYVEFGTRNTPPAAMLGRALARARGALR